MYYKKKTKAYEIQQFIYGSYTRVINDDVKGHYYYQSNFANAYYGIWFCGTKWYISYTLHKGKCQGYANSKFNTEFQLRCFKASFEAFKAFLRFLRLV